MKATYFIPKSIAAQDPEERLSPDMKRRVEAVIDKVLQYTYQILSWSENAMPPAQLRDAADADNQRDLYYTMLLNDEVHTYDQVLIILPLLHR